VRLCQFQAPGGGRRVGALAGDAMIDITAPVADLLVRRRRTAGIERLARRLAQTDPGPGPARAPGGDVGSITIEPIGTLRNPVRRPEA
jgi:hypothetical protein